MISIPQNLYARFNALLLKRHIPVSLHNYYKKWLRYYLDYCHKYQFALLNPASLPHFLNKLKEKKQTNLQQKQAGEAIGMFYELIGQHADLKKIFTQAVPQDSSAGT